MSIPLVTTVLVSCMICGCAHLPRPKAGIPRVKLEVSVSMDGSFAAKLANMDKTFQADVERRVKLMADVQDRFYASLSSEYSSSHRRPDYLMTVELGSFEAVIEKADEAGNAINAPWVREVRCSATVTLQRRQEDGPPLLVDHSRDRVRMRFGRPDPDTTAGGKHEVVVADAASGSTPVHVPTEHVLQAVEGALRKSLRPMIDSIDRELMLQAQANQRTQKVSR